jgi:hypothetical protein
MTRQTTSLDFNEDGTVTDSNTGLMWMVPLVGQGWSQGMAQGAGVVLSWDEATSRHGRARNISATSADFKWTGSVGTAYYLKYPLSRETYDEYKRGNKSHEFAGFLDWRLPTVEELWSLSQAGIKDTPLPVPPPGLRPNQLWTANPSTKSLGAIFTALDMMHSAWMFELGATSPDGYGDEPMSNHHYVRLVRAGNIFQELF